jgi:SMC interacting uncharacterized protein involved in chromosome segregation
MTEKLQADINKLYDSKNKYEKKINEINSQISRLKKEIVTKCNHEWIKVREPGQYGELWTYCKKCRVGASDT